MSLFDRARADALLNSCVKAPHIISHSYAVEAVMRALAKRLSPENEAMWAMAGLMHDLDYNLSDWQKDMALHGYTTIEILKKERLGNEELYHAILAHNAATGVEIKTPIDRAIYAADPMTGFIMAIAKVYPDQKIRSVKVKSIIKRMNEARFAATANRSAMRSIELLQIDFADFADLSLTAMCEIADLLEL